MANWSNAQQGLVSGFQVGQATGGGMSGLGSIIAKVADKLRQDRLAQQELGQKQNLLGFAGLTEGRIKPAQEGEKGSFDIPGIGRVSQVPEKEKYEPQSRDEALDFERAKAEIKTSTLSPALRKQKIKDTSELTSLLSRNKFTRQYTQEALDAADKIPGGVGGFLWKKGAEWFDPNNSMLGEWQKITSILSDIQLGKLQFTKGAISDKEMEFFKKAVANQDIASAPRIKLILRRALNELSADEEAKKAAYTRNYDEDSDEIFGASEQVADTVTIEDITGKTIQIPRSDAIKKGYING